MIWLVFGIGGLVLGTAIIRRLVRPAPAPPRLTSRRPSLELAGRGGDLPGAPGIYRLPGAPGIYRLPNARAGYKRAGTLFQFAVEHTEVLVPHWPGKRLVGHAITLRSPQLLLHPFVIRTEDWQGDPPRNYQLGPGHDSGDLDFGRWSDRPTLAGQNGELIVICWYSDKNIWPAIARAGAVARQLSAWKVNPSAGRSELRSPPDAEEAEASQWRCPMCGDPGPEGSRCFGCNQALVAAHLFREAEGTRLPAPEELRRAGKIEDEAALGEALELLGLHRIPTVIIGSPPTLCVFECDERRARHLLEALGQD